MVKKSQKEVLDNIQDFLENDKSRDHSIRQATRRLVDRSVTLVQNAISEARRQLTVEIREPQYRDHRSQIAVYPDGTKLFWQNDCLARLVLEDKPQIRTIKYCSHNYRLSFPFFYYFYCLSKSEAKSSIHWTLESFDVAVRTKPLEKLDDKVYHAPLPNVSNYGVCLGREFVGTKLPDLVNKVRTYFWTSQFNTDITDNVHAGSLPSFKKWQEKTEKDPMFVLKAHYQGGNPLSDVIGYYDTGDTDNAAWLHHVTQRALNGAVRKLDSKDIEETLRAALDQQVYLALQNAKTKFDL